MPAPQERHIRVFVSSTFRDMMGERDELMTQTWPELRQFCRERQVELIEVDLRWGITEEQSTRRETLKFCLDEIRACRPFFIGLLGERYGWSPGADAFTPDLTEEQPWLEGLHGTSVTEMEILHGVLNNPGIAGRAFFYFRDAAYAGSNGPDFLAENPEAAMRQSRLKNAIRATCAARNIPLRENYPDPRALAALVRADLESAIDEEFPRQHVSDPLAREAREHEAFAETRRRTYIGRADYDDTLDRHALGHGSPLVILGESGSGKSALLANWLQRWYRAHPADFIFQHYIGGTPDSADRRGLVARLVSEIKRWTGDPDEVPTSLDDLLRDLPLWLTKARFKAEHDGVRCILALDALNQLAEEGRARSLGWLPSHPFSGALRLVVSTLPGEAMDNLASRGWETLQVSPLTPDERGRMTTDYLARFGKRIEAPRLTQIVSARATENPLFLKMVLDELRVTGTHDNLEARLTAYLSAADIPALLQKILARYRQDYERYRPGLVGNALGLIFSARRGLGEGELLRLLRPDNLPQLPPAVWSPLRAALEDLLIDRGGILNFAHDFLRHAVAAAFAPDAAAVRRFRLLLSDEFAAQPVTARRCDELPWLLWKLEDRGRLRACLLDVDVFLAIRQREGLQGTEVRRYWVWLQEERAMGQAYLSSFDGWSREPGRDPVRVSLAANELGIYLGDAGLPAEAESLFRQALEIDERVLGAWHRKIATGLNNLGQLLRSSGGVNVAEPLFRRAVEITERDNDEAGTALILSNLGQTLHDNGEFEEAEPLMRRVLSIDERILGPDHPGVSTDINNLAELLRDTGRLEEAEPLYHRALDIDTRSFGPDHPRVAIRLNNLALVCQAAGRLEEAESLYRRALAIREGNFGAEHPAVAQNLNNIASVLQAAGLLSEAEPLYRRAIAIAENTAGPFNPDLAKFLNNLVGVLQVTRRIDEAGPLMSRALEIDERNLGPDDPLVGGRCAWLARWLRSCGRVAEAEPLSQRALLVFMKHTATNGSTHPRLQETVTDHYELLQRAGRSLREALAEINALGQPYGVHLGQNQ